jgi:Trk-type K+ transport system membrane component
MNKLHMLALTGLMFSGINNASMMGQEQREVLYTLHTLGQDFANVPMITQNSDMFKGVLEMNIQVNEAKLKDADQKIKDTLMKSAVLFTGAWVSLLAIKSLQLATFEYSPEKIRSAVPTQIVSAFINQGMGVGIGIGKICAALNIYDAWKNRSALVEAIALDKEILSKLEEIDASMDFITENTAE